MGSGMFTWTAADSSWEYCSGLKVSLDGFTPNDNVVARDINIKYYSKSNSLSPDSNFDKRKRDAEIKKH